MLSFDRTYLESKLQQHCFDVDTDNFAKKAIVQNPILDPTNYNQRCWNSSTNTSVERWNCLKDQVQAIESQTFNLQNNPEIPQSSKKFGFRSVKPPQPKTHEDTRTAIPENNSTQHAKIEQQDIFASRNYEEKIKKGWSPVKFNPHSPQTSSGEIACFSGRSRPDVNFDSQRLVLLKCFSPPHFDDETSNGKMAERTPKLLFPKINSTSQIMSESSNEKFDTSALHDHLTVDKETVANRLKDSPSTSCNKHSKNLPALYPRHFNRPINVLNHDLVESHINVASTPSTKIDKNELHKRKVSACIRLLDANTLEAQNHQKSNLSFVQIPSSLSQAHKNTAHRLTENQLPPLLSNPSSSVCEDISKNNGTLNTQKPSRSTAGFQGKGARMFAKQQERMNRYTKESTTPAKAEIGRSTSAITKTNQAAPATRAKPKIAPKPRLFAAIAEERNTLPAFRNIAGGDSQADVDQAVENVDAPAKRDERRNLSKP